jgi:sugar phosphate isomerase/epimerase
MINRRELFKGLGATAGLSLLPDVSNAYTPNKAAGSFSYCLNMATIRGHKLGFAKELEVASKAGFRGVEIWIDSLQAYLTQGGTLKDAKKRLDDTGIVVENCIGFAQWIVEDEVKRKDGLEQMKREMEMLAQIGCKRTAAPPAGATDTAVLDLNRVAERYRAASGTGRQNRCYTAPGIVGLFKKS